jgi:hypothetical protein
MADFTSVPIISKNFRAAEEILVLFRQIHSLCKIVESLFDRYNNDEAFQTEADHLFTTAQLQELNQMITNVTTLRTNWDTNHASVIEIPIPTIEAPIP